MKNEIKPLYTNVMILPYAENPYNKKVTESGLILSDDKFDSTDTGEREFLDQVIACGTVIDVGAECKYVKAGDDVFFNIVTSRPVPFQRQGFMLCGEQNILAVLADDFAKRKI